MISLCLGAPTTFHKQEWELSQRLMISIMQSFCLGRNHKKLTVAIVTGPIPFFKKPSVLTQNVNYSLLALATQ
jgi:hypothetical protein